MKLFMNDCLYTMDSFEDNYFNLIFCDLPYGITNCEWDNKIDLELLWKQIKRIRKTNCPVIFTTTTKFGVEIINSNPDEFKMDMVIHKSKKTGFLTGRKRPLCSHEMLYFFWNYPSPPYYYDKFHKYKDKAKKEYLKLKNHKNKKTNGVYENDNTINKKTKLNDNLYDPPLPTSVYKVNDNVYGNNITNGNPSGEPLFEPPLPHSVINVNCIKETEHPTSKPLDLMKWILNYYTKENDRVLDVCMGGGTLGKACQELNRDYFGIEKDHKIYSMACKYLSF